MISKILALISLNFLSAAVSGCGSSNAHLKGSISGNNSGDPIKAMFTDARRTAYDAVYLYDFSVWNSSTDVTRFMTKFDLELAQEINSMPLVWSQGNQETCARTGSAKSDAVYLDYEKCRISIRSREDAARLMIHEAIHHFGIGNSPHDEEFADMVAGDFMRARDISLKSKGNLYGALAYSPTGGQSRISYYYGSKESALNKATRLCGSDCSLQLWIQDSCAVLYATVKNPKLYTWWTNQNLAEARTRTKAHCESSHKTPCKEVQAVCSLAQSPGVSVYGGAPLEVNIYNSQVSATVLWDAPAINSSPIAIYNSLSQETIHAAVGQMVLLNLYNSQVSLRSDPSHSAFVKLNSNLNSSLSWQN